MQKETRTVSHPAADPVVALQGNTFCASQDVRVSGSLLISPCVSFIADGAQCRPSNGGESHDRTASSVSPIREEGTGPGGTGRAVFLGKGLPQSCPPEQGRFYRGKKA